MTKILTWMKNNKHKWLIPILIVLFLLAIIILNGLTSSYAGTWYTNF